MTQATTPPQNRAATLPDFAAMPLPELRIWRTAIVEAIAARDGGRDRHHREQRVPVRHPHL